jgi:hypothetical protein
MTVELSGRVMSKYTSKKQNNIMVLAVPVQSDDGSKGEQVVNVVLKKSNPGTDYKLGAQVRVKCNVSIRFAYEI